jgi:2-dehydropantoate 2-reductase
VQVRYVVLGAGAIGGVVGGRLWQAGHHVTLIARGAHLSRIQAGGLQLESADGFDTLRIPAVGDPALIEWQTGDVVLLAVKSHQTDQALGALARTAPPETPVVCLQNGISNEPAALRIFTNVQAVWVACPTSHLEPGVVQAWSSPTTGLLDVGRYPSGVDDITEQVCAAFRSATFSSRAVAAIERWKRRKLLSNLGNAVEAVCGLSARRGRLVQLVDQEGDAVMVAAGLDVASSEEDRARRGDLLRLAPIEDRQRGGGSSWQSLERGVGSIETDYLTGEIVLLGRLYGVPTPANQLLQWLSREMAAGRQSPGSVSEDQVLQRLAAPDGPAAEPVRGPLSPPAP